MSQEVRGFIEGVCFSGVLLAELLRIAHNHGDEMRDGGIGLVGTTGGHVAAGT